MQKETILLVFLLHITILGPWANGPAHFFLAWAGLGRAQPSPTRKFLGRAQPTQTPTRDSGRVLEMRGRVGSGLTMRAAGRVGPIPLRVFSSFLLFIQTFFELFMDLWHGSASITQFL